MKLADQKDFEQWASEQGFSTDKDSNGSYRAATTDAAWGGWLAAVQTEREACIRICEQRKIITPEWQLDQHFNQGVSYCVNAIRVRMRL